VLVEEGTAQEVQIEGLKGPQQVSARVLENKR